MTQHEPPGGKPPRARGFLPFPIRVHSSWLLLATLLAGLFAVLHTRGNSGIGILPAVGIGVFTSLLLLLSVLGHELAHAAAAHRCGLKVSGITLKVLGGVTELGGDPANPAVELRIALAGPFVTLLLTLGFFAAGQVFAPAPVVTVANNLALINGLLLVFNLIPSAPLDGGRILRAALWALWRRPAAATRAVAAAGRSFGLLMIGFGVLAVLGGADAGAAQLVSGVWFVLIGLHLRRTSREVTRQLWFTETLHGVTAAHLLDYRIPAVQRGVSGQDLASMESPHSEIPVLEEEQLIGSVRLEDLRRRPAAEWDRITAGNLMRTEIVEQTLHPEDAAIRAVPLLSDGRRSVAVLDAGQLVGIITLETLRKRLSLRTEV